MTSPAHFARSSADAIALAIVERLCETVAGENDAIALRLAFDHHSCSLRKSQGLLELNRLSPVFAGAAASPTLRNALGRFSAVLEENQRRLRVRLEAAKTVSNIVARAIRDSQSDGTYSAQAWRGGDE